MRKPIIAANWKMNKVREDAKSFVSEFLPLMGDFDPQKADVVLLPPFLSLSVVAEATRDSSVAVGAQDFFWEPKGAYTGEVSTQMLVDVGCTYALVGHSERRRVNDESNEWCNKKLKAALKAGLYPIYCIGETLEEREAGKIEAVLGSQIREGLADISAEQFLTIAIAYEPVWAIGTGKTATPGQANEAHEFIRKVLAEVYGNQCADPCRILYGGSVTPDNAVELMAQEHVDGALVGGASLKPDSFWSIVSASAQ